MPYPKVFYQRITQSVSGFSNVPTGQLNINRLLLNQPAWASSVPVQISRCKHLIVTDWTAKFWLIETIEAASEIFSQLIDAGFPLLLWQQGILLPLAKERLIFLEEDIQKTDIACEEQVLKKAMLDFHLTRDDIWLLDDYWMRVLLGRQTECAPRYLYLSDLLRGAIHLEKQMQIIDRLKSAMPRLEGVCNDVFSEHAMDQLQLLKIQFPDLPIVHRYDRAHFSQSQDINALLETGWMQIGQDMMLTTAMLHAIRHLCLHQQTFSKERLWILLKQMPYLEFICFEGCDGLQEIELPVGSLSALKHLHVIDTILPKETLEVFLKAAPHLMTLRLYLDHWDIEMLDVNDLLDDLNIPPDSLPQLRCLLIQTCLLAEQGTFLSVLLRAASCLRSLELQQITPLMLTLPPNSLLALEKLDMSDSVEFDAALLQTLLQAGPRIKCLMLSESILKEDYALEDFTILPNDLYYLAYLEAFNCNIEPQFLSLLLLAAPNVQILDLSGLEYCDNFEGDFSLPPDTLLRLRELKFSGALLIDVSLQMACFRTLLKAAPLLEEIIYQKGVPILEDDHLSEVDCIAPNSLMKLKTLSLSVAQVEKGQAALSTAFFMELLLASPFLETLYCRDMKLDQEGQLMLPKDSLPALKHIHYSRDLIGESNIINLLQAAPHLETQKDYAGIHHVTEKVITEEKESTTEPATVSTTPLSCLPIESSHNAALFKDFVPSENVSFHYAHQQALVGYHRMIIHKLSQFLILTHQDQAQLTWIQKGICFALSHLFLEYTLDGWNGLLADLAAWDGHDQSLSTSLKQHFIALQQQVSRHMKNIDCFYYIGEQGLLAYWERLQPTVLANPWHMIAIRPHQDHWVVYDPNFRFGPKIVLDYSALLACVKQSIGEVLMVTSEQSPLMTFALKDWNAFLSNGGFLVLQRIDITQCCTLLQHMPPATEWTKEALAGLLLRDMQGVPAWVHIVCHVQMRSFFFQWVECFLLQHAQDGWLQLEKSVAVLKSHEKRSLFDTISGFSKESVIYHPLIEMLDRLFHKDLYALQLNKHAQMSQHNMTKEDFYKMCFETDRVLNRMIIVSSADAIDWTGYFVCEATRLKGYPVFYAGFPEELVCGRYHIQCHPDNSGVLMKGPGGPFYDFLKTNRSGCSAVLIINYDHFTLEDFIRLDTLWSHNRSLEGVSLPDDLMIIGLINQRRSDYYPDAHFFSRFERIHYLYYRQTINRSTEVARTTAYAQSLTGDVAVIDVFHQPDWKRMILGEWGLEGNRLVFQEGCFLHALKTTAHAMMLLNIPHDDSLKQFLYQIFSEKKLTYMSRVIPIGEKLKFFFGENPPESCLSACFQMSDQILSGGLVLNPGRFFTFISRYEYEPNQIKRVSGWIPQAADQTLRVNVTRTLTIDQWAWLLSVSQMHRVTLNVYCAPTVSLPNALTEGLTIKTPLLFQPSVWDKKSVSPVIQTTDVETTVFLLKQEYSFLVIDLTDCEPSDLLECVQGSFHEESMTFSFHQLPGVLAQALAEGQRILLKGQASAALADELAVVLLRLFDACSTVVAMPILIVTEDAGFFSYLPVAHHQVEEADKKRCLGLMQTVSTSLKKQRLLHDPQTMLAPFMQESLSRLIARQAALERGEAIHQPWMGLQTLSVTLEQSAWNPSTSLLEARQFQQDRLEAVHRVLRYAPYVALSGLSGVGKTTFVEEECCQQEDTLYVGEKAMATWAADQAASRYAILFLDEANIHPKWNVFEGLFESPPQVIIEGKLWRVSTRHKVIFAMNPNDYGDERQAVKLFNQHGHVIIFNPMPPAVIYERILKHLFNNTPLLSEAVVVSAHLLHLYQWFCHASTKQILISPRELQTIVLLTIVSMMEQPHVESLTIVKQIAWEVGRLLVPERQQVDFDRAFKPDHLLAVATPNVLSPSYWMADSHRTPYLQLRAFLRLRILRRQQFVEDSQRYGGLGGLLVGGEEASGKSCFILAVLQAEGYQECVDDDHEKPEKAFYNMPNSLSLADKEALLRKAFHEGAIVVMKHLNAFAMMEKLLNHLLMGKTPENERPRQPGFLIIGTKGSVMREGYRFLSPALERRFLTMHLPAYHRAELIAILEHRGVSQSRAIAMVDAYEKQCHACQQKGSPAPTLHDLFRLGMQSIVRTTPKEATSVFASSVQTMGLFAPVIPPETRLDRTTMTPSKSSLM